MEKISSLPEEAGEDMVEEQRLLSMAVKFNQRLFKEAGPTR